MSTTPLRAADASDAVTSVTPGWAEFESVRASGVVECIDLRTDAHRLDEGGVWFVVGNFSGGGRAWRFAQVEWAQPDRADAWAHPEDYPATEWAGPARDAWTSSCSKQEYLDGIATIRDLIRAGTVYQVNLTRVLSAPLAVPDAVGPDAFGLAQVLGRGNPAPYAGVIHVPAAPGIEPVWVVSASPELYLERDGAHLRSGPIKGTAPTAEQLLPKDSAENVMITDLVRNDLHRVCTPESVQVEQLLALEAHPGLVHLVSTVAGRIADPTLHAADGGSWQRIFAATFPPGSVAGAPKLAALDVIEELEAVDRGPYCGAIGWIDADRNRARLAVGIRTFWWAQNRLNFGTGAGITWGSDPATEWDETELKARRLVGLASPRQEESA